MLGGGASEIRQTWGGTCPKRLKNPALENVLCERLGSSFDINNIISALMFYFSTVF